MVRVLLAVILMTSLVNAQPNNNSLVDWSDSYKLTWADFRGTPPPQATNAALTSSGILINFTYNDKSLSFEITCNFDRSKSWGRIKNEHILAHEQAHFDITEIHARKLYKRLKAYRFNKSTVSKDIHELYQGVVDELQQMQHEYDRETDHSRNFFQQKNWLDKVQAELLQYKDFANYSKAG